MKHSKLILLWLLMTCASMTTGAKLQSPPGGQTFTLLGQLKLDRIGIQTGAQSNAPQGAPPLIARLYPPKDTKRPVLLAYLDGGGKFYFQDIPGGSYLLEIYYESNMIYQKAFTVSNSTSLDDNAVSLRVGKLNSGEPIRVCEQIKLEQRSSVALKCPEFQERLTLSVGDIDTNGSLTIKIYETRSKRSIAKKDHRGNVYLEFKYDNKNYLVTGRPEVGKRDYLYFEVYRKAS